MCSIRWLVLGCLAAAAAWAVTPASAEETKPQKPTVGILEFTISNADAPGFNRNRAGTICADALSEALVKWGQCTVAEREQLKRIMDEMKLQLGGLVDPAQAAKLGQLSAVNFLVYGDVLRVSQKKNGILEFGTAYEAQVSFKVTNLQTGQVVWQSVIAENARDTTATEAREANVDDLVTKALRLTSIKAAEQMAQSMREKVTGMVAQVNAGNGQIIINRGTARGVVKGMIFEVFRQGGDAIIDPETGKPMGGARTHVGWAIAIAVNEAMATLEAGVWDPAKKKWKTDKKQLGGVQVKDLAEEITP